MSCSNDVKCPNAVSSFQSNFTFGQIEADPWSPASQNEADTLVPQQQHITLSNCARFSLSSDGTAEGTLVGDESKPDESTCPRLQNTPTMTALDSLVQKTSSRAWPQTHTTTMPQVEHSGHEPRRGTSKNLLLTAIVIGLLLLLPGTHASFDLRSRDDFQRRVELRIRAVSDRTKVFAQDFSADLADKLNAQGLDGYTFAHNLVANVVSSVCGNYLGGTKPDDFTPAILQDCVKGIYGNGDLIQPAEQFLAIFGASLLCDYVVSEAYPVAQEFFFGRMRRASGACQKSLHEASCVCNRCCFHCKASHVAIGSVSKSGTIKSSRFRSYYFSQKYTTN
jgi:hypothetical protein